jgi:SnoaL-like domain
MIDVEHRTADLRRARPIRGRAAIEELTVVWLRETPQFEFEISGLLADESTAAYRWSYEVPGASDAVAVEGITWLACADGMISEALVCFDSYALMQGMGTARPA